MSYVRWAGDALNMSKGTISMWFRVPKATIDGVIYEVPNTELAPLKNIVPLVVFSSQPTGSYTDFYTPIINTFYYQTNPGVNPPIYAPVPYSGLLPATMQLPYWPSMIGVHHGEGGKASLAVVLQTKDVSQPDNTAQAVTGAEGEVHDGHLFGPTKVIFENVSWADAKLEWFPHNGDGGPEVKPDVWHHVLISWDIRAGNSSEGNTDPLSNKELSEYMLTKSTFYCAFDDENMTENKLPIGYWTDGFGPNEIICTGCFSVAGAPYPPPGEKGPTESPYMGPPSYEVVFANGIKMDTVAVPSEPTYECWLGPIGSNRVPPSPDVEKLEAIKKIEVAELQIFSGFLLDTNDKNKRRAFIDIMEKSTDADDEEERPELMGPVNPKDTEELLGRRPDILLHTSRNWKKGRNTGKIGLQRFEDEPDQILEAGQFKPSGKIPKWKPDPRLLAGGGGIVPEKPENV